MVMRLLAFDDDVALLISRVARWLNTGIAHLSVRLDTCLVMASEGLSL